MHWGQLTVDVSVRVRVFRYEGADVAMCVRACVCLQVCVLALKRCKPHTVYCRCFVPLYCEHKDRSVNVCTLL